MPSSEMAPSKATARRSQFHATRPAVTARPASVSRASAPRRAFGQKATTMSRTSPAPARASSGAIARQATWGAGSGDSAIWASRCTGSSIEPGATPPGGHGAGVGGVLERLERAAGLAGARLGGDLGDPPGRRLDALEQRAREHAERDDRGQQRDDDRPLAPGEVGGVAGAGTGAGAGSGAGGGGQGALPHALVRPEHVDGTQD